MDYRAYSPSPALRTWVRHFWILEGPPATAETIYPDGCMEIAIHLGDTFTDARGPQHHSLFIGQMDGPLTVHSGRQTLCVGVKFEPAGAAAFIPMPLDDSPGIVRPLDDAWDRDGRELRERLGQVRTDPERISLFESSLAKRQNRRAAAANAFLAAAIHRLLDGGIRIDDAARAAGLSTRQFERRVRSLAGASPKLLARVARFQRALAESQSGRADWASIAAECGYFDQPHLIRDFRQFTGASPTRCEPGSALGASAMRIPEQV